MAVSLAEPATEAGREEPVMLLEGRGRWCPACRGPVAMLPDRYHCYDCKRQFDLGTRGLMNGRYWTAANTRVVTPMTVARLNQAARSVTELPRALTRAS